MENLDLSLDSSFTHGFILVILYTFIFLLARYIRGWFSPFKVGQQLVHEDNTAFAVSIAGYFIGITAVFTGASTGESQGLFIDLMTSTAYAIAGILVMNLSRVINDKIILDQFSNTHQIIKERNIAAGILQGAYYIASGLIVAGAITGESGGPLQAFVFFIIGQLLLVVFCRVYIGIAGYSVHDELKAKNIAVGLSFAGNLIALSLIIMKAISGEFSSWIDSLILLSVDVALIAIYLILVRLFFDRLIIPGSKLKKELIEDKNIGAGVLEMLVALCFAFVIVFLF